MRYKQLVLILTVFAGPLAIPGNVDAQADAGVTPIPMINYQLLGQTIAGYGATNIRYEFFRLDRYDKFPSKVRGVTVDAKYTLGIQESSFGLLRENLQGDRINTLVAGQMCLGFSSYDVWGSFHRLYDENTKIKMPFTTPENPLGTGLEDFLINSDLFSYSGGVGLNASRLISLKVGFEYLSYIANVHFVLPFSETDLDGSRLVASLKLGNVSPSLLFYAGTRATLKGFFKSPRSNPRSNAVAPTPMDVVIPEYRGIAVRIPVLERVTVGAGATYVNYESIPQFRFRNKVFLQSSLVIEIIEDQTLVSVGFAHTPDIQEPHEIEFFNFGRISTLSFGLDWRRDWLGLGLTYVNSSWLSEYDPLTDRLLLTLSTSSVF